MPEQPIEVRFPIAGVHERLDYMAQPPNTAYAANNVFSDGMITERERGGSRAGTGKLFAAQLGGGAKVRLVNSLRYVSDGVVNNILVASAGGTLYKESAGNWTAISSSCTLASDRQLSSIDFYGILYIADNGPVLAEATDGVVGGGSLNELTSATVGNFASAGVNDDDHFLVIRRHNAVNEVQTVTVDATGGTFMLRDEDANLTTTPLAENVSAADMEDALEVIYGTGNVTVSGSAGGPYTVTFQGDLAGTRMGLMTADEDFLTGGASTATVARTTRGADVEQYAGTYDISTVVTSTLTFSKTLQALTGVSFYVARCPKKYDPVANTLTKWIQDSYTAVEAENLGDDDLDGTYKGAIPVGRTMIVQFNNRIYMAGGIISPNTIDCCRQGDEVDWDYARTDVGRAVSSTVDPNAKITEPVTALVPHQHSCMLIGCKTSTWVLRGDITAGEIDNVSLHVGFLDKHSWAVTPEGLLFFMSLDGLYLIDNPCGSNPQSVSREILPRRLRNIDTSTYTVSMGYCNFHRMLKVAVTENAGVAPGTFYLIDYKLSINGDRPAAAFWPQSFADEDHEAFFIHERRDKASGYSVMVMGCRDGYTRIFKYDLAQDDGQNFSSYVWIGPIALSSSEFVFGRLNELAAVIPANSGNISVTVYAGDTVELALSDTHAKTFSWNDTGRSLSTYVRKRGVCAFLKISNGENNARWEFSKAILTVLDGGKVRV